MHITRCGALTFMIIFAYASNAEEVNYKELLVGKWGYLPKEDGSYWGYDEYFADGRVHAWGMNPETKQSWEIWGTVELNGNVSCSTTTKSSDPEVIPVGVKICDEIVSIDANSLIWRHRDGNMTIVEKVIEKEPR